MKKAPYLILMIPILFLMAYSTSNKNNLDSEEDIAKETPHILLVDNNERTSSFSKGKHSDIITKLYKEAIKKNDKLNTLNDAINNIGKVKSDSLQGYRHFSQTNNDYWSTAKRYINQLQDSALKQSTLQTFLAIESNYRTKISKYEKKLSVINNKTLSLNDRLVLMKLFVTGAMIKNYQINEEPRIKTLENIINEYDRLIKETEEFSQISK
jgi:hypothetical protein